MPTRSSRRRFLGHVGAAGFAATLTGLAPRRLPASDRVNLAIIGCGGQGAENLKLLETENIVAMCDVDDARAAEAFSAHPKARKFRDYRRLLDTAHATIDAVVVTTPDHMHAPISLAAMDLGKHVYCEKPLTWGIAEARRMAQVAREKRVATQMGTQGMADDGARAGIEAIRSGVLGDVTAMHVWTDRAKGWWPQGVGRPAGSPPVRPGLDWDLWLGVAPRRPYHPDYCPFTWRGFQDFGTGAVGDMGIHNAAMPFAALELGPPSRAELVDCSGRNAETFPARSRVKLDFPARGNRPALTLHWYDGGQKPSPGLIGKTALADNGAIVVGTKGTLYSVEWTGGDWHLLPDATSKDFKPPAKTQPRAPHGSHHQEWLAACRGGPPAFCRFDGFAATLTETMLVANLAIRTGKTIEWDAEKLEARGCPEASAFVRRTYRTGW